MLKLFRRWPVWILLLTLVLVALVPAFVFSHHETTVKAKGFTGHVRVPHLSTHLKALVAPSLSASTNTVSVYRTISVIGQGFDANEAVQLQLDNTNTLVLKSLTTDSNGAFTGSITMPASSIVEGLHPLIATGMTSGLAAQTPLTFIASLSTTPLHGSAWTNITLNGGSFAANEPVDIYWGNQSSPTHISTATTDSNGNLSYTFTPPTGTVAGKYPITVYRFRQTPRTIGMNFQVIPPKITTSIAGIHVGQSVQAQLKYFQPYESVAISWSANNGQQLATTTLDGTGAGSVTFTPPSASHGSYTLIATGNSSNVQAIGHLNIGPGIALSVNSAGASSTITVSGGGYTSGETVNVYFQTIANGVVPVIVNTDGTFSTLLTVPSVYRSGMNYSVYANGTVQGDSAKTPFTFVAPSVTCISGCSVYYGNQASFSGQGFAAHETVNIYWLYGQAGQTLAGTGTADGQGNFSANITNAPSAPQGYITVTAYGATSHLSAATPTNTVYEYARVLLATYSATVGTSVPVSVGGFYRNEAIALLFNGITILSGATDSRGLFSSAFTVPSEGYGYYTVQINGGTSGIWINTTFYIRPSLTLTSKTSSSVTIDGNGFNPNVTVSVYWYSPYYNLIGYYSSTSTGSFEVTILSSALLSGNTYTFCAYDYGSNQTVCGSVVVQ